MKKTLSLLLAAAMLLSLLPSVTLAAEPDKITFDFTEMTELNWSGNSKAAEENSLKVVAKKGGAAYILFRADIGKSAEYNAVLEYYSDTDQRGADFDLYIFDDADLAENGLTASSSMAKMAESFTPINGRTKISTPNEAPATAHTADFSEIELKSSEETNNYLLFVISGTVRQGNKNSNPRAYISSLTLTEVMGLGVFDKVEVSLDGVKAGDPMPRATERQLSFTMIDSNEAVMTDANASEIEVEYASSDEDVAVVSESGVVSALKNGKAKITVKVTYQNSITKTGEYNLTVEDCGANLMEELNPGFDTDAWYWDAKQSTEIFQSITLAEQSQGSGNTAMKVTYNPEIAPEKNPAVITLAKGRLVKAEPGRFYEASVRIKLEDWITPENAKDMNLIFQIYGYDTVNRGSSVAAFCRTVNLDAEEGFRSTYGEWTEFKFPIAAPTAQYNGSEIYLTPRIAVRPSRDADYSALGYSGTLWLDDFQIREVGYEGVEVSAEGVDGAAENGSITVNARPYASSGSYISIGTGWVTGDTSFSASDSRSITGFSGTALYSPNTGESYVSATASLGGKNGETEICAAAELNGIVREGKTEASIEGFPQKLLYADITTDAGEYIPIGESAALFAKAYFSDGTEADMTEGSITYTSLSPEVISVSDDGIVTALDEGSASVDVTFTLGEYTLTESVKLLAADISPVSYARIEGSGTVGHLRDMQLVLYGTRESGRETNFANDTVHWVVEECSPDGGVTVDENGLVFGHEFGAVAKIHAEIEREGAENYVTNTLTVKVVESDLRDFVVSFSEPDCEPLEVSLDRYGWEINTEKSDASALEGAISADGLYSKTKKNILAIDVNVPYEGAYQVMFYSSYSGSNARSADIYIDGIWAGTHDYGLAGRKVSKLRTVYLTAGTHTFYFDALSEGKNGKLYHTLYKMQFSAVKEIAKPVEIKTDAEEYNPAPGFSISLGTRVLSDDATYFSGEKTYSGEQDPMMQISYRSSSDETVTVSEDGTIIAKAPGEAVITITAKNKNGYEITKSVPVTVTEDGESGVLGMVGIKASSFVMSPEAHGVELTALGKSKSGKTDVDLENAVLTWESSDEAVIRLDGDGEKIYARPVSEGVAEITLKAVLDGETAETSVYMSVRKGKTGRTFYTDDRVANARENITKYTWAKEEKDAAIKAADKYIGMEETLWSIVPGNGIPRSNSVGYKNDPDMHYCRYCGAYLYEKYGRRGYSADPLTRPWKIQCRECKRLFPSNDFEGFYKLGLDENGVFSREKALVENGKLCGTIAEDGTVLDKSNPYGYGNTNGYLYNKLYEELWKDSTKESYNKDPRTGDEVVGIEWGVDDGMGYDTGRYIDSAGIAEVHTYIAYYHHVALWYDGSSTGFIWEALKNLSEAYIYTGDKKYGCAGAILLDRIADLYPDYSIIPYLTASNNKGEGDGIFYVSSGGTTAGKVVGSIWETFIAERIALAYDAFFPAFDEPEVVSFLDNKAKTLGLSDKLDEAGNVTPETLRQNCEDGILREIYKGAETAQIKGNFGMVQANMAVAAVVLDTFPDTREMIDWIFAQSKTDGETYNTGGGLNQKFAEELSRDGQGNESAPGYNKIWITDLSLAASTLARYPEYDGMDLYENPRYIAMINSYAPLTVVRRGVPPIGDSSSTANYSKLPNDDSVLIEAFAVTRNVDIARHFYKMKSGETDGLHYDIFTKNPETLVDDLEAVIEEHGEYDYDKSSMLTGYGFGALRSGTLYDSVGNNVIRDIQRDFWMYFGGAISHSNYDKLHLGIESYGIPFTTDLGYPEATGANPNKHQWLNTTLAHNAVVVDEKNQMQFDFNQQPLHFDAKDTRVKVMDVDASPVYIETDEYRRTVVMVDYDSEVSYGIDFFKVTGGDDHIYSFHACSEENPETSENLTFVKKQGTYAGEDTEFGNDPWTDESDADSPLKYPRGYTWLYDIHKAENPGESEFWLDFKIKDYRKFSNNGGMNHRLRMTVLNDFEADEVTLANGLPPRTANNLPYIDHMEYMLVRRKGSDLSSLFTTVIEPYNGERYIKEIQNVAIEPSASSEVLPGEHDSAKAIKVTLADGRCDYIVYAQNNDVTYTVTDGDYSFDFRGFVGVWTVNADRENIYSYINDGELIGTGEAALSGLDREITGTITGFQNELSFDNWIELELDCELGEEAAESVADRLMNIDNPAKLGNSSFIIRNVTMKSPSLAHIDLGNVTLIDGFVNPDNEALGYSYDAEIGRQVTIPMSYEVNPAPEFDAVSDNITTSAGSAVSVTVSAKSEDGAVTYKARMLPRGASFNESTATVTWKPDASQIGENLFAIDACDGSGRSNTVYFTVTVYGSTTGSSSNNANNSSSSDGSAAGGASTGASGGGGGGAGGGSDNPNNAGSDTTDETGNEPASTQPDVGFGGSDEPKFTDLGNYPWAADAINSLAAAGIVRGTTATTYSPAADITRADFALLLVRAFNLTSDNTENFADVTASDYFAPELAVARNTGIVQGIGANLYAPRNSITRQDMMVIVYRALTTLEKMPPFSRGREAVEDGGGILPSQSASLTALPEGEPSETGAGATEQKPSPVGEGGPLAVDEALLSERYGDWDSVAPYARDAVSYLITNGIVNGKSGKIAPTDCTTRAEVAVLIKRIMDHVK